MSNKIINIKDYNKCNNVKFDECSKDIQMKLIKQKLYEELEQYYEETMKVIDKFKNEFAIFNYTIHIIDNPSLNRDIVYQYMLNIIEAFVEGKNILSCDDEQYEQMRSLLFAKIKEHYFDGINV